MALDLKTLGVRSITATVFVIVLLSCVFLSYFSFLTLFFVVSILALREFYSLSEKVGVKPFREVGIASGIFTFLSIYSLQLPSNSLFDDLVKNAIYLVPFIVALKFLFTKNENPFQDLAFTMAGVFYCIIPFALLVKIPTVAGDSVNELAANYNYFKVLGIIFLIWANDTFAYLGGSLIGKHKLYERVSPGKTWEGTFIGILCCIGIGFLLNLNHTFSQQWLWPLIAFVIGVFGTIGDLIESLMKRKAGVKDSGTLMPGHGGVLDRFDSLLFVSPFVYVILKLVEN